MFTHPISCHHPDPSREAFRGHVGEDPWVTLLHITQLQFSGGEPSSAVSVFSCHLFTMRHKPHRRKNHVYSILLFFLGAYKGPNTACSVGIRGLLSWISGKESTHQCRRLVFDPWSGKIPRAAEQLSPGTTTYWACALESGNWSYRALEPMLCKRSHCSEKPVPRNWRTVPAPCNWSLCPATRTQHSQNKEIKNL